MPISATDVLSAMITPALLISASGTLVLSTSNRLTRVVDRVRVLGREAEALAATEGVDTPAHHAAKQALVADQVGRLSRRALLLRSALTILYTAIGFLVATSISIGLVSLLHERWSSVPVILGLAGACALMAASLQLIREARLAVSSTLHELDYIKQAVGRKALAR